VREEESEGCLSCPYPNTPNADKRLREGGFMLRNAGSMVLVVAADDKYAMPMAVTLFSALVNYTGKDPLEIYVFDGGISRANQIKVKRCVDRASSQKATLHWVKTDPDKVRNLESIRWFSQAMYLRLLIPDYLPKNCEKVLYLDSDLIVEDDLAKLWGTRIDDHAIHAVQDPLMPFVTDAYGKKQCLRTGADLFNTGVLLLNLRRFRSERLRDKAFDYIKRMKGRLYLPDQDALNFAANENWGRLHPRWNIPISQITTKGGLWNTISWKRMELMVDKLLDSPGIYHFMGDIKPWELDKWDPSQYIFFHYLQMSGWIPEDEWNRWKLSVISRKLKAYGSIGKKAA
jgi:lipopolysaccharide biosynthesis glycosyltransferase